MCTCDKEYLGTCDEGSCDDPYNDWDEDDMVGDDIDNEGYSSTCNGSHGSSYDCCDDEDDDWWRGDTDDGSDCHCSDSGDGGYCLEDCWMGMMPQDENCCDFSITDCSPEHCPENDWQDTPSDNCEWCDNTWCDSTGNDDICHCTDSDGSNSCDNDCGYPYGDGCEDEVEDAEDKTWMDTDECRESEQSLRMVPESITLRKGVETSILLQTYPCGESVTELATWHSSDASIVRVDQKGNITTMKDGTATITATYNGMTVSCKVFVDSRPVVRVEKKQENHFWVDFIQYTAEEAYRWKSVGCDLNLPENRSGYDIWNEDEDLLLPAERNYKYNCGYDYTYDQLALLYRLDPFGVILYVKNYAQSHYGGDIKNQLVYKDNVYIAIFGYDRDHFYFRPDSNGNVVYYRLNDLNYRDDYYSHAEALFGQHTIIDGWELVTAVINLAFGVVSIFIPPLGFAISGVELAQALFLSDSIIDLTSWTTSQTLESYIKEKGGKWKGELFNLGSVLLSFASDVINAIDEFDVMDLELCKCLQRMKYRVVLRNEGKEVQVTDLLH